MTGRVETSEPGVAKSSVTKGPIAQPTTGTERVLVEVVAELLALERVSVDSNFFEELGADSMVMARVCARVRKQGGVASISMKDVYSHPTIRTLAAALQDGAATSHEKAAPAPTPVTKRASTRQYLVCGTLQFLFFCGYAYLAALGVGAGYAWISGGAGPAEVYLRALEFGAVAFCIVCAVPIVAKWILIGRFKPRQIPIWSLAYVRFWIVKTLIRSNPAALLFVGSPLYVLYLRALGAKIGPGAAIFSRRVPVCADLLTIGAGAVVRRESFFLCYRARAGYIETGAVTLGRGAFVGERAVLDINSSMGSGAQLGHTSSLHSGQAVPDDERWHGSPAQRTDVNYLRVPPARCGMLRRAGFCAVTLVAVLLLYVPLVAGGVDLLASAVPSLGQVLEPAGVAVSPQGLLIAATVLSSALFFGAIVIGLLALTLVARVVGLVLKPNRVYPLYGLHDRVHRAIVRLGHVKLFPRLFGDSAYIVGHLSRLGYKLSPVEQTGSNFGIQVTQASPRLSSVGTGTMIADGLAILNDELSSTSFSLSRVSIGPHNFLGNDVTYPAGGKTGANCLLATKAMIPLEGEVHEGVGLLGSPSFEIPRTVDRDTRFDHLRTGDELRSGLAAKTRHNLRTLGLFIFARWLGVFLVTLIDLAAFELYGALGDVPTAVLFALSLVVGGFYFALVERCVAGFRSLRPTYCSIYHPYFWQHERLWKLLPMEYLHVFDGTPFKNMIWRLLGVRIGRRVLDDGAYITERTLTTIGDDCVLNQHAKIQCHSQEDGTFKSDRSTLGAGCTLGVAALVHYGVTMDDGSVLAPDSFLMKGEEVPAGARWGGNPARELKHDRYQLF